MSSECFQGSYTEGTVPEKISACFVKANMQQCFPYLQFHLLPIAKWVNFQTCLKVYMMRAIGSSASFPLTYG